MEKIESNVTIAEIVLSAIFGIFCLSLDCIGELDMSHELDDNIERRKQIVLMVPKKGLLPHEFLALIMSFGYNRRGAQSKVKELKFLKMVEEREGKIFACK